MTQAVFQTSRQDADKALPGFIREPGRRIAQKRFAEVKAKRKSRAGSHQAEFLNRVFSAEGASRFFRTFLLRFLFDTSGSSDDSSGRATA